jgi:hypothetical protein
METELSATKPAGNSSAAQRKSPAPAKEALGSSSHRKTPFAASTVFVGVAVGDANADQASSRATATFAAEPDAHQSSYRSLQQHWTMRLHP